jgi:hypothetical protein
MQAQYGFTPQRTRLLVDDRQAAAALGLAVAGAPTRARVLECVAELAADAERSNGGECPRLFVYVSAPDAREGDTAYLALGGFDPAAPGATGLTVQELTGRLAGAFAWGHQLIVLDAAVGAGSDAADSAPATAPATGPVTAAGVGEDWIRPVQVIVTAGAADARLTPGLLSERVFKSLGEFGAVDGNRDGVVTDAELVAHLGAPAHGRRGRGQFLLFR